MSIVFGGKHMTPKLKKNLNNLQRHYNAQKKLIYAMRQVAIQLLLELTEDGADMTGEELEKEIDRRIFLQCQANEIQDKATKLL